MSIFRHVLRHFLCLANIFLSKNRLTKIFTLAGTGVGLIAGISYLGIGLSPGDLYLPIHLTFVYLAFSSIVVASVFYAIVFYLNPDYPKLYLKTMILFILFSFIYVYILFFGPSNKTEEGLIFQVISQN